MLAKRHQRRHPSPRERTPCPSSKCALPTRRRPCRHARNQRQQRLHQQPPLPVALCLAQPAKRGKHQCSPRDTSAAVSLLMSAPLAFPASAHSLHAGDHFATRQQQRLHLQPPLPAALCLAQPTKSGKHQCSQETLVPTLLSTESTTCPPSKCALPTRGHFAPREQQQRLHQKAPLPAALCLAQPTKSRKHQCSQ